MPSHEQITVEPPRRERGLGSSDTTSLQTEFPESPIHSGVLTKTTIRTQGNELLVIGEVDDKGHTFGIFNRDYPESPNLEEVTEDARGRPMSSPYAPSLASPLKGADDYEGQPTTVEQTEQAGTRSSAPFVGEGLASPHNTAKKVANQTIGSLKNGTSEPTST
jgi:hypothetical protein